jgi:tRNA-dihydrouridine synthase B
MRMSARRCGCRFAFTEMIDAGSLVFGSFKTLKLIERDPSEDWLGVQLVGSEVDTLKKAVEILNQREFDVIDFNLGCPAPKVVKKGEGAALALRHDDALRAFETIVKSARHPVTAKTRIQSETDPAPTIALAKRLQDAGAQALTLHGRVMKAFYSGPVFHQIIKAVRESLTIQVVANGGAFDKESCETLLKESSCDCAMLARGAIGNPWLFGEISTPGFRHPTQFELADEMERHIGEMVSFYGEEMALVVGRKVMLEYLRGRGYAGALRASVSFISKMEEFLRLVAEVRKGPAEGYWRNLETATTPQPRRLSPLA